MKITNKARNIILALSALCIIISLMVIIAKQHGLIKNGAPATCAINCVQTIQKGAPGKPTVFFVEYLGPFNGPNTELFTMKLDKVRQQSKPKDMLMVRIESSGGATSACKLAYDELRDMKNWGLKIGAISDYGMLSCGYMLASAADSIYASSGAEVGNIGVVSMFRKSGAVVIGTTRTKEIYAGSAPENKAEEDMVRAKMQKTYEDFKSKVMKTRKGIKPEAMNGSFYSDQEAIDVGLVDTKMNSKQFMRIQKKSGNTIVRVK